MVASSVFPRLLFCSLFLLSSAYHLPDVYFINCGSASNVSFYGQEFAGDEGTVKSVSLSGESEPIEDPNSSDPGIYRSARIFRKRSSYEFGIDQDGVYAVRFHFLPFHSLGNLPDIHFSVSASGFSHLFNYTGGSRNSSDFSLIEDFLLKIPGDKFRIDFVPYGKGFAFVNAIEVFLAPAGFLPDTDVTHVSRKRVEKELNVLLNKPLRVVHRINVGGPKITPGNDTLLRYWIPDDDVGFMLNVNTAKASKVYEGKPNYQFGGATEFDAPDYVYRTAKEMNFVEGGINDFNASWRFDVRKRTRHFVRLHFCDMVTPTTNENVRFNLYIYSEYSREIWPSRVHPQPVAPFFDDFVVDSDDSGFMNISIGLNGNSGDQTRPFLNGVEIMELLQDLSLAPNASSSKRILIIVCPSVGGVILVIIILASFLSLRKRKRELVENFECSLINFQGRSSYSRTTLRSSGSPFADLNLGLRISFAEILYATKRFNAKSIIGEGGFGKVYKGMLRDGTKVAVKRGEPEKGQGLSEFQTEIVVLTKIRHHHLVSLIGYCNENNEMILVYEFMEKGTLREHLYTIEGESSSRRSTSTSKLSWDERLQICIGAAKGLDYLHKGLSGAIIHRDVKSSNILLDEHYVAKVADFGLSRLGPSDQIPLSTEVKGSFGYLDPEYCNSMQLTQKSDVYSFGVVLLEVLCSRPAVGPWLPKEQVNLADWGMSWQRQGQLEEIIDPSLIGRINPNSLRNFGQMVEKCLHEYGTDRPNMEDVLWDLEYCLRLQHTAAPRYPYEDSTTDVAMGFPIHVVQRLPSDNVGEVDMTSAFSDASQVDAEEVFSQLNLGEAR